MLVSLPGSAGVTTEVVARTEVTSRTGHCMPQTACVQTTLYIIRLHTVCAGHTVSNYIGTGSDHRLLEFTGVQPPDLRMRSPVVAALLTAGSGAVISGHSERCRPPLLACLTRSARRLRAAGRAWPTLRASWAGVGSWVCGFVGRRGSVGPWGGVWWSRTVSGYRMGAGGGRQPSATEPIASHP